MQKYLNFSMHSCMIEAIYLQLIARGQFLGFSFILTSRFCQCFVGLKERDMHLSHLSQPLMPFWKVNKEGLSMYAEVLKFFYA